jgi:hypothetical protein
MEMRSTAAIDAAVMPLRRRSLERRRPDLERCGLVVYTDTPRYVPEEMKPTDVCSLPLTGNDVRRLSESDVYVVITGIYRYRRLSRLLRRISVNDRSQQ